MSKKLISSLLFLCLVSPLGISQADETLPASYHIEITNLTKGQPITPPMIALHNQAYDLYTLGKPASTGLAMLAKDGAAAELISEVMLHNPNSTIVPTGQLIFPGETLKIDMMTTSNQLVSFAAMLARTNDAFIAMQNIDIKRLKDNMMTMLVPVYDAGAETNNESCTYIPAPPCNNPHVDTVDNEGFVHPHPGVYGAGDLVLTRDAIASHAALITIKKMK